MKPDSGIPHNQNPSPHPSGSLRKGLRGMGLLLGVVRDPRWYPVAGNSPGFPALYPTPRNPPSFPV
jgi:hypothetical protein